MKTMSTTEVQYVGGGDGACSADAFKTAAGEGAVSGALGAMLTGQIEAVPGGFVMGAVMGVVMQGLECAKS